ncbi:hypothetical protein [Streptomyces sp. NPDC026673]|uniref:hypothetical protein n=1 Tax=Streptomyces sp. NPDC026673 TaxID=3155724 RepID=UPI0033FD6678
MRSEALESHRDDQPADASAERRSARRTARTHRSSPSGGDPAGLAAGIDGRRGPLTPHGRDVRRSGRVDGVETVPRAAARTTLR